MALKLTKPGDNARLSLKKAEPQAIRVNLKWEAKPVEPKDQPKPSGGILSSIFGGRPAKPAPVVAQDLDLGCMYEMNDRSKHVIQALGKNFGSDKAFPYIMLDKDDRSGTSTDGENLVIARPDLIKRVLLFAYFYEGDSDFRSLKTKVTLKATGHEDIIIELDNPSASKKFCGLAMVSFDGKDIVIQKEEQYFADHQSCDAHYGFNFNWTRATK